MTIRRTLRFAAVAEGISLLLLLLVAMPLKYFFGLPVAVSIAGSLHGILFLWFCWALIGARLELGFGARRLFRLLLAAVLPFGFLFIERELCESNGRSMSQRRGRGAARRRRWRRLGGLSLLVAGLASGCAHSGDDYRSCDAVPPQKLGRLPAHLSETGLYRDPLLTQVAATVQAYQPRFELWSDGALKRRWVELPKGQPIDTEDMDAWQFPQGTKLWKEFSYAGKRIETRLLMKLGPAADHWVAAAYVWSSDGADAVLTPEGRANAMGTAHDVPSAAECFGCHGGTQSRVLGFTAIQLGAVDAAESDVSLRSLSDSGALSHPPSRAITLPGDAAAQQALGYLHGNCGHCHNQQRPERTGARCYDPDREFDLSLRTDELSSVRDTAAYRSTLDGIVVPGDPEHSELYRRMEGGSIFLERMPPVATHELDRRALSAVFRWIEGLPRRQSLSMGAGSRPPR